MKIILLIIMIQLFTTIIEITIFGLEKNSLLIILGNTLLGLNQYFLINGISKITHHKTKMGIPIKEIVFSKMSLLLAILAFFKINAYLLYSASLIYVVQLLLITFIINKKKLYEK